MHKIYVKSVKHGYKIYVFYKYKFLVTAAALPPGAKRHQKIYLLVKYAVLGVGPMRVWGSLARYSPPDALRRGEKNSLAQAHMPHLVGVPFRLLQMVHFECLNL